tara:strand:+ start:71 stop:637 length:567 start_codon:yes stop_codon:yes gene_type:complete
VRLQKEFFKGFKVFKKLAEYLASKAFIFLTIFVLGSVTGIAYALIKLDRDNYLASVRSNLEEAMHVTTDQIQLRFFEAVLVAKTVESILLVSGGTVEKQISRVVEEYQRHNPAVIAVALAPDLEVTHSFPQTKTEVQLASNIGKSLRRWQASRRHFVIIARWWTDRSPSFRAVKAIFFIIQFFCQTQI